MLGWIPVLIVGIFLIGCIVFSVASVHKIFKVISRGKKKDKPLFLVTKKQQHFAS